MPTHKVKQGECIETIAAQYGHLPKTIWDDPKNAALNKQRGDPNVLAPGDSVHVPEPRSRKELCTAGRHHRFERTALTTTLRITFEHPNGTPRKNIPYKLTIGSKSFSGKLDGSGELKQTIPVSAQRGTLELIDPDDEPEEFDLEFGHLDPIDENTGVQARLANLGFYGGEIDGDIGALTTDALQAFQGSVGLNPTGTLDQSTKDQLTSKYRG